jgi:hypothetical protein
MAAAGLLFTQSTWQLAASLELDVSLVAESLASVAWESPVDVESVVDESVVEPVSAVCVSPNESPAASPDVVGVNDDELLQAARVSEAKARKSVRIGVV